MVNRIQTFLIIILFSIFSLVSSANAEVKVVTSINEQEWAEAKLLDLDCSHTEKNLLWKSALNLDDSLKLTSDAYKLFVKKDNNSEFKSLIENQINQYQKIQNDRTN